jgi:hypothetical protein
VLAQVTHLSLYGTGLSDAGARVLAVSKGLNKLEILTLSGNVAVGDATASALALSPRLGRLRELSLLGTSVTRQGVAALVRSPHLPALRTLNVAAYNKEIEDYDESQFADLLEELRRK